MSPVETCPGCGARLMVAVDFTTGQRVLLDPKPAFGGRVEVKRPPLTQSLVAVDHITAPAPQQPAYELHVRTCPTPGPVEPVNLDDDPVFEQTGGWRR